MLKLLILGVLLFSLCGGCYSSGSGEQYCPKCGGTGEIEQVVGQRLRIKTFDGMETCPLCKGKGKVPKL